MDTKPVRKTLIIQSYDDTNSVEVCLISEVWLDKDKKHFHYPPGKGPKVETLLKKHATPDAAQWRRYQVKKLVKVCGKLILKRR